ncbi:hypothetical protein M0R04_09245 [Candidatus Dojkabacteria bacterium]|jgi:hypothetical protein|nr:hypothetical protein [Candidatus Dojkabacteria bacterium]
MANLNETFYQVWLDTNISPTTQFLDRELAKKEAERVCREYKSTVYLVESKIIGACESIVTAQWSADSLFENVQGSGSASKSL